MRLLLALFILLSSSSVLYAEEHDGSAEFSSTWGHEDGFSVANEKLSRAAEFLKAVRPEEFNNTKKSAAEHQQVQSDSSGTRR